MAHVILSGLQLDVSPETVDQLKMYLAQPEQRWVPLAANDGTKFIPAHVIAFQDVALQGKEGAIELTKNLVNSLGDQANAVAANIGK